LILLHHRHNPGSKPQALPSVIYYWPQRCTEVNKALTGLRAINNFYKKIICNNEMVFTMSGA
jgi:hypothetical protein